jgi:hypothetical protein
VEAREERFVGEEGAEGQAQGYPVLAEPGERLPGQRRIVDPAEVVVVPARPAHQPDGARRGAPLDDAERVAGQAAHAGHARRPGGPVGALDAAGELGREDGERHGAIIHHSRVSRSRAAGRRCHPG